MWKQGLIDSNVAMQLLGREMGEMNDDSQGLDQPMHDTSGADNAKKRPRDDDHPNEAAASGLGSDSLDDVLENAKRAKMDTFPINLYMIISCDFCIVIVLQMFYIEHVINIYSIHEFTTCDYDFVLPANNVDY